MDFLVSEADIPTIVTESLDDELYPGLTVYEMTDAQKEAVIDAREKMTHLSPIMSDDESESEPETESEREEEITKEEPNTVENAPKQDMKPIEKKD